MKFLKNLLMLTLLILPLYSFSQSAKTMKMEECCDEIKVLDRQSVMTKIEAGSTWYVWSENDKVNVEVGSPTSLLSGKRTTWVATLLTRNGEFVKQISVRVKKDKLTMNTKGLASGDYYIEVLHAATLFRTAFRVP